MGEESSCSYTAGDNALAKSTRIEDLESDTQLYTYFVETGAWDCGAMGGRDDA